MTGLGTLKSMRHLLPSRRATPFAFAINATWMLLTCVGLTYLALMSSVLLPNIDFEAYNRFFVTSTSLALPQLLAIAIGSWVLYSYMYIVAAPGLRYIEHGRSRVHLPVIAAGILRIFIRLAHVWASLLTKIVPHTLVLAWSASLLSLARQSSRTHLAHRWRAGTHPPLVYS